LEITEKGVGGRAGKGAEEKGLAGASYTHNSSTGFALKMSKNRGGVNEMRQPGAPFLRE